MGAFTSRPSDTIETCANDYELVIRSCKALHHLLLPLASSPVRSEAHHPGLHDVINACALPQALDKKLRYLATLRNALVHDVAVVRLDDRDGFVSTFVSARAELLAMVQAKLETRSPSGSSGGACAIA